MTASGQDLQALLASALGTDVTLDDGAGVPCLDVPVASWANAAWHARDSWGFAFFDWLSAVDCTDLDPPGFDVVLHLAAPRDDDRPLRRLLLRTRVPAADPSLPSLTGVFPGAAWHERETHEMFGLDVEGFDDGSGEGLRPLLLPDGFVGTPLRKSFQLAARAAKPWPGAKEPGESDAGAAAPSRRKLLPPGVPDPVTWGPRRPGAAVASGGGAASAETAAGAAGRADASADEGADGGEPGA